MRTVFLVLLTIVIAVPAAGQNDIDERRSALSGTWVQAGDAPELRLTIDTATATDTLRLRLTGRRAPPSVYAETIVCALGESKAQSLPLTVCPRTTLTRKAPPRDVTLRFQPRSKPERGLRQVTHRFTSDPRPKNDTLTVGSDERFRLVKQP